MSLGDEFSGPEFPQIISEFLAQFMTPEVANFLSTPVSKALSDVASNKVGLPGGMSIPTGLGDMFAGPRSIELQSSNQFVQNSINNSLQGAASVSTGVRMDMRDNLAQGLFGTQADTGLSALNLASDLFLHGSLGLDDMQDNMNNAGRYMGVTAPFFTGDSGLSTRQSDNFATMSGFLTADRAYNSGKYGGMSAPDTGTLISEMARTGSFSNLNLGAVSAQDLSSYAQDGSGDISAEVKPQLDQIRQKVRAASELVGEFQRVFRTDVADAMDKMTTLFGTDVPSTFSPERMQSMASSAPSAGLATGFTSAQVFGMAAASKGQANAAGFSDFTGGLSAGVLTAQLFRASANEDIEGDSPFAFVNPMQYRDTLVKRVTGARLSDLSRDISGAAAILARENGNVEGFREALGEHKGQLSSEQVAEMASGYGSTGMDAAGIRDASYSQEARRYLEEGIGDNAVLQNNASFLSGVRRQTLDHVLRQNGITDVDVKGPLTSRAIRDALGTERGGIADQLDNIFTQNAKAFGFQSMEAEDTFMNTIQRNNQLKELQVRTSNISDLQGYIGGITDSVSGFEAFSNLVLSGEVGDATLGKIFQTFSGSETADITGMFGGASVFNTDNIKGQRAKDLRKLAIGTATSVLFGGQFGKRAATENEVDAVKEMFSGDTSAERREELFKEFEGTVSDDAGTRSLMFELDFQERARNFTKGVPRETGREDMDNLRQSAFLDQFDRVDDLGLVKGTRTGQAEIDFRAHLTKASRKYKNAAWTGEDVGLTEAEEDAMVTARREATLNDELGGVKKGGTASIVAVLGEILTAIKDAKGSPVANTKGDN